MVQTYNRTSLFRMMSLAAMLLCFGTIFFTLHGRSSASINLSGVVRANGKIAFTSFRDGDPEIYTMDANGGNLTRLTFTPGNDSQPTWSPDGTKIAFTSPRDGNQNIYIMNADGSNQTGITTNPAADAQAAWSPDGAFIAFATNRDGNAEIYVMNADGSGQVNITNHPGTDVFPSWTVDGRITFLSNRNGNTQVFIMNPDGSNPTMITNPANGGCVHQKASLTTSKVVFINQGADFNREVYTMNLDGTGLTRLTNDPAEDIFPTWSPDGSKVLFIKGVGADIPGGNENYELYTVGADGTNLTRITNNPGTDYQPAWQPLRANGQIAFISGRDGNLEIYTMGPGGSNQTPLLTSPASELNPAWSYDGSKIAYVSNQDGNNEIYVMNADGTGQTRLTNDPGSDGQPNWSPDGTKITFISNRVVGNTDIYVMNADGSNPTRLTTVPAQDIEPQWSPDGSKILFVSRRPVNGVVISRIWTMNPDGTDQSLLINSGSGDLDAAWSPDGTRIAFRSARDGNNEIYMANANGTNQTRLTNSPAFDSQPSWSPDGTKIAFPSDRDNSSLITDIYVMDTDGGNLTRLTTATGGQPTWQPLRSTPTPPGSNVTVVSGDVSITFSGVTSAGATAAAPIDPEAAGQIPSQYTITGTVLAYEITTTATITPPITICFNVPMINDESAFSELRILHGENGILVDRTTSRDFASRTICATVNSLSPFIVAQVKIPVSVDIKPGVSSNTINLRSNGTVPVAILSTANFDATTINPLSVTLANAGVQLRENGTPMASSADVNGDGRLDLVVHITTNALQLTANSTVAELRGRTFSGVLVEGMDSVQVTN